MLSEVVRYIGAGGLAVTVCGGTVRIITLKMKINFHRYVIDRAFEQGQPIDPVEIIDITTLRTRYHHPITQDQTRSTNKPQRPEGNAGRFANSRDAAAEAPSSAEQNVAEADHQREEADAPTVEMAERPTGSLPPPRPTRTVPQRRAPPRRSAAPSTGEHAWKPKGG